MFVVGKILGMMFVAPFSSRFGRKLPLILAMMICVAGAGIQAGAANFGMLVFSRCLLGFGSSLMMLPGPIIIAEIAYPTHRGKLTAMLNVFYCYGAILAACLEHDWGWRIPTLLQGATPALQLNFVWFVPESPRFLTAKGRIQEARNILVYHHAGGDQASPLVKRPRTSVAWSRVLRSPANRRRLLISAITGIASQWAGNAVISYYLALAHDEVGITDATQQAAINGGLQDFNLLAALGFESLLVNRLGRVLFLWSAVGMTCSYTALTIVNSRFAATQSKSLGYAFISIIFLFYFHYNIAMTPFLYSYPPEIWPYHLRTWGTAFTLITAYVSLIVALKTLDWRYYIIFCVLNAVYVLLVYFFSLERKGKTLEEVAEIFEGAARSRGGGNLEGKNV
ncbi:general substrate transporter [Aspergillus keveii]|uniref:General substrate transporter n=1 Tax=Aspergillus keveii TaxID=714993 RepID=A0ABR4GHP9_9EURO